VVLQKRSMFSPSEEARGHAYADCFFPELVDEGTVATTLDVYNLTTRQSECQCWTASHPWRLRL
jgi:hypothetical protein